ncbi:diacylglycerol kinase epsilon-like [Lineus longissimus]|uniref:diacylglycerol kinase epsilon-like n=1 Tax=Lineus longissimus TaxID=88925 RepID=UPI00315CCED7
MASFLLIMGFVTFMMILTIIITRFCKRNRKPHYDLQVRDISKGHRWVMMDMFTHPVYCNISGAHIVEGAVCDSCGICVDDHNMKEANRTLHCKLLAERADILKHQWIKGNLPLCSRCVVCEEQCGLLPQICDLKCCWCQRTVHDNCQKRLTELCDLGQYRDLIVPPNCVQLKQVGWKGRRHLVVGSVREPPIKNWSPLVVIANRKSGNGDGEHILQAYRRLLNPAQVIDLHDLPPENALEWCRLVPNITCRVLVCGGDGTIGWVLNAIDKLGLNPAPYVSILPLGTGNDLSRVLQWGEGYVHGEIDVEQILDKLEMAKHVKLDRWKVEVTGHKRLGIGLPRRRKTVMMNNYSSIGVDARVTLNFHQHRESQPYLFGSRIINKLWYFTYGTKDIYERECKDLQKRIKLELDGVEVQMPEIEGIVVLNISSWAGGCQPWEIGLGPHGQQARYDDGLVEVMGLYSSFHVAQLHVGLAEPYRFGQAKTVKITLTKGKAPMQVDGEPWNQSAGEIMITRTGQANMLACDS